MTVPVAFVVWGTAVVIPSQRIASLISTSIVATPLFFLFFTYVRRVQRDKARFISMSWAVAGVQIGLTIYPVLAFALEPDGSREIGGILIGLAVIGIFALMIHLRIHFLIKAESGP